MDWGISNPVMPKVEIEEKIAQELYPLGTLVNLQS